jgi:hypothetical protein
MFARSLLFLSAFAFFAASAPVPAQQLPAAQIAVIEAEMPAKQGPADEPALNRYVIDRTKLMVDIIWKTEHLTGPKPSIDTQMLNTRIAPYINGTTITFPVLYANLMDQIGVTLGHDIYAGGDNFPVVKPVLQHPYAEPYLLQSMDPAIMFFQNNWYQTYQDLIACKPDVTGCQNMQGMVRYATSLFLVAHECGHYVHGDTQEGLDETREKNADAFAWDVIHKVAAAYHTDDPDVNKTFDEMFGAGAFAFLNFEIQTNQLRIRSLGGDPTQDNAVAILEHRFDALQGLAGDELSDTISDLLPEDPVSTNYRSVTLQWTTVPDVLMVNGTLLSVHGEASKSLLLGSRTLHIIAWSLDGVAFLASSRVPDGPITLQYQSYLDGSPDDIQQALKNRDWNTVLRMGTRDRAAKSGAWAVPSVNRALERNQAIALIDPTPTGDANVDRAASYNASRSKALSAWGLDSRR